MAPASPEREEVEEQSDGSEIYEVERILDMKIVRGKRKFLIRWKGYDEDEDSWEPEDNLGGANEIVDAYLKEHDKPKSQKLKATPKSAPRPPPKRSTSSLRHEKDDKEVESDVESEKSEDDDFEPSQKKSKKGPHTPKKGVKEATNGNRSQLDKAVDRRKNISSNLRWIAESSDESDNEEVVVEDPPENNSPDNIHPDSSTDSKSSEPNKTVSDSQETSGSLKLKISVNNDRAENGSENGKSVEEDAKEKRKSDKKAKKQERNESPQKSSDAGKPIISFNGIYVNDRDKSTYYVGVNQKTKEVKQYTLAEAYMADGWSLARYLDNKVTFSQNGQVSVHADGKK